MIGGENSKYMHSIREYRYYRYPVIPIHFIVRHKDYFTGNYSNNMLPFLAISLAYLALAENIFNANLYLEN